MWVLYNSVCIVSPIGSEEMLRRAGVIGHVHLTTPIERAELRRRVKNKLQLDRFLSAVIWIKAELNKEM